MGTSKVHWTEVAGADPYSEDELREMGTSKEHWSELADADPYSENELREMNKETFGNLKAQWSHFFLDNTENLVVGKKLAVGAQASIFEAHWPDWEGVLPHSNGLVLKVFDRGCLLRHLQPQWSEEFLRYANHAKLWNPRICRIFGGLLLDNGAFAFAMERCWGDLRSVIDTRMWNNGNQGSPFSTTVAKRIMLEIAEGIQGLHELGIIHRDVNASNIFIKPIDDVLEDPEAVYIPIRSFDDVHGDTKASDVPILSSGKGWNPIKDDAFSCVVGSYECSVGVVGTAFWRAPEILLACKNRDLRSLSFTQAVDVYSYSMTCYEILTGGIPFEGFSLSNYDHVLNGNRPQLPKTVDLATKTLLSRCWHHDPSQRPTFIEICKELRIMISQPEPIALEPQVDNEGNLEPVALSQSNCFPQELNGFKSFHTLIVGLLMFLEPISNVLASFTDLGCYFFMSFIQWIYIYLGSFGQHKEQASICMRVRSRDLKLVQFLGQGFSGFIYETSWLTWYGREKPGRFARKSFPRVGNMVFESEAIRLVHLDHPNVVKVFCWTVDKLGCSLVLEFVNTDIESVVEKRKEAQWKVSASQGLLGLGNLDKSINGTISPFELVDQIYIMLHIARAMEYLHSKGVGHGDLRPNNILVDLEADPMIVKVVDFGLLESKKRSSLVSKRTQFVRTLEWKAPETWKELPTSLLDSPDEYLWDEMDLMKEGGNASAVGELVDVYSFAVTCTYIMGGTISYPKLSLSQLQQEISSGTLRPKIPSKCPEVLRKLIELSWDSDPQKRLRFSYLRAQLEESFHLLEQVKEKAQAKGAFSVFRFFGATMESESQQLEDPSDVCKRGRTGEAALCTEENTNDRSSEGTSSDPVLEPKHKIFLSHSGAQKEFVEHLCEALERRFHYPFFYKRPSSLPKGEKFPRLIIQATQQCEMAVVVVFFDKCPSSLPKGEKFPRLIIQAAQQCEMAVVVVSEEYFMSKWPMVELNAFVQARRQESNKKLQILPLFYGLSVSEFREERRRERWYAQWESFAKDDAQGRIKVDEWKDALSELGSFNGILYNWELKEIVAYENAVVSSICHSIKPDFKWDDLHVQGKSNICEVVCKNIEQVGLSRRYNVKVVGLYGVGGIGKTTLCKTLCNELSHEYGGRVCHVEFESKGTSSKGLLEKVLMHLTNASLEDLQQMDEGESRDILQKTLSRDKTFLAVDNVWDDHESIEQAKTFLKGPFCEGSLVIVTSRSWRTLELLGVDGDASFEVPDLGLEDAMNLFLYHAAGGKRFVKEEEKRDILECLQRCYFKKGDGGGWHYHPLALEALGSQLSCLGDKPSEWVENLWRVKNFSYLSGGNPVFGILRSSFDLLPLCDQSLFMDLVVYRPSNWLRRSWEIDMKEWLCLVHKQDEAEIKCRLDFLKRRGLLQDVDLASGEVRMHDLYREFAELEVRGKLDESTGLEKRRWGYLDDGDVSELESPPSVGLSHKLIRLVLKFPRSKNITESLEVINWQYCSNVVVLKLKGDLRWRGVLSLEPLKCLRSFSLQGVWGLDRVEGLEGLKNLTYFTWVNYDSRRLGRGEKAQRHMGRFPASLRVLEIEDVEVLFGPDVLARCTKLRTLRLRGVQVGTLDVCNCSSLQTLDVREVDDLRTLSGLTARSGLKSLKVLYCRDLDDVPGLEQVAGLEQLVLKSHRSMAHLQLDLQKLTKLRAFKIYGESFSRFSLPRQLQELTLGSSSISSTNAQDEVVRPRVIEALKANRLEQLQVLRLYRCDVSGLENVGGWPALRCLDLTFCTSLSGLPDLSQSTNLEELNLGWTEGELCEDDVCMLARLRQLQPVPIGRRGNVRLDLVRRKELYYPLSAPRAWIDWKEHEWHERDLGIPPYGLN